MKIVDQVCEGTLPGAAADSALAAASLTPGLVLFTFIAAASRGVIYGALDTASLLL